MSDTAIAFMSAAVALIGAMVTGAVTYLKVSDKIQERRDESALGPLRQALAIREKDCDRLSIQVSKLSEAVEHLIAENADCFIDMGTIYSWAEQSERLIGRLTKQCGIDVTGEISPLPPRRERPRRAEFAARTVQQSAILVQAASGTSHPPAGS